MRSRRTFQILLLSDNVKNESIVSGFGTFSESDHSWEKWNCFMKCPETIAFSFTVLFLKSFRVTSIQHSIIFHNIYQLVIKRPPCACTRHHKLYYVIAVGCSDCLSSCGERKNRTRSYLLAEAWGTPLWHLHCVVLRSFYVRACVALRCSTVCYGLLRCVALRNFYVRTCVALRCVALPIAGNRALFFLLWLIFKSYLLFSGKLHIFTIFPSPF